MPARVAEVGHQRGSGARQGDAGRCGWGNLGDPKRRDGCRCHLLGLDCLDKGGVLLQGCRKALDTLQAAAFVSEPGRDAGLERGNGGGGQGGEGWGRGVWG